MDGEGVENGKQKKFKLDGANDNVLKAGDLVYFESDKTRSSGQAYRIITTDSDCIFLSIKDGETIDPPGVPQHQGRADGKSRSGPPLAHELIPHRHEEGSRRSGRC